MVSKIRLESFSVKSTSMKRWNFPERSFRNGNAGTLYQRIWRVLAEVDSQHQGRVKRGQRPRRGIQRHLKRETLAGAAAFTDDAACRREIFRWATTRYNTKRRHSYLRHQAPNTYENKLTATLPEAA